MRSTPALQLPEQADSAYITTALRHLTAIYLQTVIAVFMVLFGINFTFYILLLARKFKQSFRMEELWVYFGIIAVSVVLIAFNISSMYPTAYDAFHQSFFYVSSIITTTGFGIEDVTKWPEFSQAVIVIITFIGAMAGSTGGGFKVSRVILLFKEARKEFALLVHPRNVKSVKMDGKTVEHSVMRTTSIFLVVYIGIFALSYLFDFIWITLILQRVLRLLRQTLTIQVRDLEQ